MDVNQGSIFEVQAPYYSKARQHRLWLLCVLLLCISVGTSTIVLALEILSIYPIDLGVGSFIFLFRIGQTGFALIAALFFLRKIRTGWMMAVGLTSFHIATAFLSALAMIKLGINLFLLHSYIMVACDFIFLCFALLPAVKQLYGVRKQLPLRIIGLGSLVGFLYLIASALIPILIY